MVYNDKRAPLIIAILIPLIICAVFNRTTSFIKFLILGDLLVMDQGVKSGPCEEKFQTFPAQDKI